VIATGVANEKANAKPKPLGTRNTKARRHIHSPLDGHGAAATARALFDVARNKK
jgi:hypothetical protein